MASWPTLLGFLLLTCNSAIAIHRSGMHTATTLFVAVTYATLLLLLYCLRRFETAPPGSAARDHARAGVWLATTLLTAMFSWRVSALMPPPLAAAVWLTGCTTVIGGFYVLFFLHRQAIRTGYREGLRRRLWALRAAHSAVSWSGMHTATTLFVAVTYATLILLLHCLRRFETAPPGSAARDHARAGVWLTTTLLTAMFSWRVSALMPPPLAAAVWLTGGCSTVIGGFYVLFLLPPRPDTTDG